MSTQIQPDSTQRVAKSLAEADQFRRVGKMADAERVCRAALAIDPDSPQLLNYLGLLVRGRGQLDEAAALLGRAVNLAPREAALHNNYGTTQRRLGNLAGAELALRTAIALQGTYPEAYFNLGIVMRELGIFQEALAAQRRAVLQKPDYAEALIEICMLLHREDKDVEALKTIDTALTFAPKSFDAHYYRGTVLTALDRFDEAVEETNIALSLRPNDARALHALGNTLARMRRDEDAIAQYRKALDVNPSFMEAHRDYSALIWQMGRRDESLKSYTDARTRIGDTPDLLLAEADRRILFGENETAEKLLRNGHQKAPERTDIANSLARALTAQKKYDEAVALLGELVKRAPREIYNHRDMAIALLQMGEPREAARVLEEALTIAPHDQVNLAYLTLAYRELGDSRLNDLVDLEKFVRVYDIAAPSGFSDVAAFNNALGEDLMNLHTRNVEPFDQTLRGGTQTPGYLFHRPTRTIGGVRDQIRAAVADYVKNLPDDPNHPLLGRKEETFDYATAWSCRLRSSGYHTNHVHARGWISSAYYVSLPDVVSEGSGEQGWIKFGESNIGLGERDRAERIVKPGVGKLVLFPSYFWHGTVPFTSDDMRLTIAFDVTPGTAQDRKASSSY
ncbi:MAG TPA: tetratricopeptide repeat protein [Rhizomicrobium sp.]|nr:tetratricopeptide repeat protein [Rhizomicrobium sp.]